jgi:SAM-dependent methyltransferase
VTQRTPHEEYERTYSTPALHDSWRRTWGRIIGDEFPRDADPYSFVTRSQLERIAAGLGVGEDATFADLGCGRGGPGMWVARATGASLIGIDFSEAASAQAAQRVEEFGLRGRARCQVGELATTGLPAGALDGAMSADALQIARSRRAAFDEVARILRPSARLCFTTWDALPGAPKREGRDHVEESRPLLEAAGFDVLTYDEITNWREPARAAYAMVLAQEAELRKDYPPYVAAELLADARIAPQNFDFARRIFVVAERRP